MGKKEEESTTVLSSRYSGGPHNLGDPDDRRLRKVEVEVLVPKVMRRIAQTELCFAQVDQFQKCCQSAGLLLTFKCKEENEAMKNCLVGWFNDDQFKKRCTDIYLEERSEYRRTGLKQKVRKFIKAREEARLRGEELPIE